MKEFLIGAAGIILAGAALAQAPTAPPAVPQVAPVPPTFDREQTRDEVVAKVREHFAQLDANRDGFLTREEADSGRKVMKERIRTKLGERREHRMERRDPAAGFDRLDSNKDGAISRDEFAKAHEMRIERRAERKDRQPGAAGGEHRRLKMHRMSGRMMGGHMFEMADANKDGRVTLQEATDAAVRHFDTADANRDGRITPDERRQIHRQMIEKRRAPKAG
jgi:Ca2+-binding EF-hand superfamily protein